ncbi:MAG TPA: AAA family ATPase [Chloroflexota bacterium]|nr:AAA family ATPase [Chloroflexota bacterium]
MGGELAQALGAEAWQPPRYEPVEEERGIWEEAIARADPAYIAGAAQQMMAAHVGLRWRLGFGCIGIYGAPGTGKNALLREVAAAWRVPIFSVDLSAGLDLVELVGGTALVSGSTVERVGKLTWWAQRGALLVLNEIQAVEPTMQTLLHDLVAERRVVITSLEGPPQAIRLHPGTFVAVTWNPFQGRMPEPALLSRLGAIEFPQPSAADETKILASRLAAADPQIARPAADLTRDVALFTDLRQLYDQQELALYPDMRFALNFVAHRVASGLPAATRTLGALALTGVGERQRSLRQLERVLVAHYPQAKGLLAA